MPGAAWKGLLTSRNPDRRLSSSFRHHHRAVLQSLSLSPSRRHRFVQWLLQLLLSSWRHHFNMAMIFLLQVVERGFVRLPPSFVYTKILVGERCRQVIPIQLWLGQRTALSWLRQLLPGTEWHHVLVRLEEDASFACFRLPASGKPSLLMKVVRLLWYSSQYLSGCLQLNWEDFYQNPSNIPSFYFPEKTWRLCGVFSSHFRFLASEKWEFSCDVVRLFQQLFHLLYCFHSLVWEDFDLNSRYLSSFSRLSVPVFSSFTWLSSTQCVFTPSWLSSSPFSGHLWPKPYRIVVFSYRDVTSSCYPLSPGFCN